MPVHPGRAVETAGRLLVAGSVPVLAIGVRPGGQRRAVSAVVVARVGGESGGTADMNSRLLSASTLSSGCGRSKGLALSANQGSVVGWPRGSIGAAEGFVEVRGATWPATRFLGLVMARGSFVTWRWAAVEVPADWCC